MATEFSSLPATLQGSFGFHGPTTGPAMAAIESPESQASSISHHKQIAHWFRLFVGWVPRHYTESNLKPIFDRSGNVKDIIILKDKVSGQPKGCAFVSYATEGEAERAIAELDRKIQLPGASSPMEVRFARSHQYIQAGTGPQDNRQLFFSRAPVGATESELKEAFEQFGMVEEVNIFADRKTNMSKGCGFIMMASRDQALHAIEGLNEKYIMQGAATTLAVKWADPDLQSKKKKAVEEANSDKRTVLGGHKDGLPSFPGGDSRNAWDNAEGEAIAKWIDAQMPKKRVEAHPAVMMRPGQQNRSTNGAGRICRMPNTNTFYNVPPSATLLAAQPHAMRRLDYTHDVPPLGCQSDAIKLFIGNIPKTYTAENLRPLFDRIGTVIELVVVRDKLTDESKGSAFVWYQTRCEAERAISELHLRHGLHDPTGEQDRPLVVRRANPKAPPLLLQSTAVMPPPHLTPMPTHTSFQHQPTMMDSSLDFPEHLQGSFLPGVLGIDQNPSSSISRLSSEFNSMALQQLGSARKVPGGTDQCLLPKTQESLPLPSDFLDLGVQDLLHSQPLDAVTLPNRESLDYLRSSDAYSSVMSSNPLPSSGPYQLPPVCQSMASMHSNPLQVQSIQRSGQNVPVPVTKSNLYVGQMTLALPVTPHQGSVVGANLHTIQAGSGALIQLAPGANDSYVIMLSGTEAQVNTAKTVVQELIGSGLN